MASDVFKKSWPYFAIVLAHTIWGINFVVAKLALQEFPPMSLAFLRFILAILFLLPFILTEKKKSKLAREDLPKLFAVGIFMVTLNIGLFYTGMQRTTVTSASVLTMVIPMLSVLAGWWFLREKIYTVNLIGIVLGLIGAILVIGVPYFALGLQPISNALIGNILIILASAAWVAGAGLSKGLLQKYSTLTVTSMIFLVGILSFAVPALTEYLKNPGWVHQVTYIGLFGLLFSAIASSVSAYFLFEWGLSKLGIVKADLFQYLEPLVAITLGVAILGEQMRFTFIIGAILVGLGSYWTTLAKESHKYHKAHRH